MNTSHRLLKIAVAVLLYGFAAWVPAAAAQGSVPQACARADLARPTPHAAAPRDPAADKWAAAGFGPYGNLMLKLALSAGHPSTLYTLAWSQKIELYRSRDGGLFWEQRSTPAQLTDLATTSLTPSLVFATTSTSIYRSRDGGDAWTEVLSQPYLSALVVSPLSPTLVFASDGGILYRSADLGESWITRTLRAPNLTGTLTLKVALSPLSSTLVFAANRDNSSLSNRAGVELFPSLYRSGDGGLSWTPVPTTSVDAASPPLSKVYDVALSPATPNIVYAASVNGTYRSDDGGQRWRRVGPEIKAMALSARDPQVLFGFTSDWGSAVRSADGGATWQEVIPLPTGYASTVVVDPQTPGRVYAATEQGIYRSDDDGLNWVFSERGIPAEQLTGVAVSPADPNQLYAVGSKLYHRSSGSPFWEGSVPTDFQLPAAVQPHPRNPAIAYLRTNSHLYRSDDYGATWKVQSQLPPAQVAFSPSNPDQLYAVNYGGFFRSSDGGASWSKPRQITPPGDTTTPTAIKVDPTKPGTVYISYSSAATGQCTGPSGAIIRSDDYGATWRQVLYTGYVYGLEIDPLHTETLYATLSYSLLRSDDGGVTWKDVKLNNFAISALVLDPRSSGTLYLAYKNEGGIYRSADGGVTWSQYGLDGREVRALAITSSGPPVLYAVTDQGLVVNGAEPLLKIDARDGAPGSSLRIDAVQLPPTSTVQIAVNGVALSSTLTTTSLGELSFALTTSAKAQPGAYLVTITSTSVVSGQQATLRATESYQLRSGASLLEVPASLPALAVPSTVEALPRRLYLAQVGR